MKVLFAAGGTGGHIYPAIAVAKELIARDAATEVLFVGTARGLETRIVPESGFQLSLIHSAGLKSVGLIGKLRGLSVLPKSFVESRRILADFKPDVVVGAGGYVSGPVVLTASLMRIPSMVMDSNALPGFTNRQLARFVDKAALTFDEAMPYFGRKGVVTGNPVRSEFFDVSSREVSIPIRILIFGGSQGARAINQAMIDALPELSSGDISLAVTHQTGESDAERVSTAYNDFPNVSAEVRPYIANIVEEFEKADLIVCRAGATTCSEVAAAGRASIMIPLPTAADDHQRKNAEALQQHDAAVMILQSALSGRSLADAILDLLDHPDKLRRMGEAARKMSRPDAAKAAAELIEELAAR